MNKPILLLAILMLAVVLATAACSSSSDDKSTIKVTDELETIETTEEFETTDERGVVSGEELAAEFDKIAESIEKTNTVIEEFENLKIVDFEVATSTDLAELMLGSDVKTEIFEDRGVIGCSAVNKNMELLVSQFADELEASKYFMAMESSLETAGYMSRERLGYDEISVLYTNSEISALVCVLQKAEFVIMLKETSEEFVTPTPSVIEKDLGIVTHFEAPKTWTIDIPDGYTKVEIATYGKGKDEANAYGGWQAALTINNIDVWSFVSYDNEKGGLIFDSIQDKTVWESTGTGKYLDVTDFVHSGSNEIKYYHYTSGGGIGIKLRIYAST